MANPCLGCPMQNRIRKWHFSSFFFWVTDLKSTAEKIRGVVHYVNYVTDFPFKWIVKFLMRIVCIIRVKKTLSENTLIGVVQAYATVWSDMDMKRCMAGTPSDHWVRDPSVMPGFRRVHLSNPTSYNETFYLRFYCTFAFNIGTVIKNPFTSAAQTATYSF